MRVEFGARALRFSREFVRNAFGMGGPKMVDFGGFRGGAEKWCFWLFLEGWLESVFLGVFGRLMRVGWWCEFWCEWCEFCGIV